MEERENPKRVRNIRFYSGTIHICLQVGMSTFTACGLFPRPDCHQTDDQENCTRCQLLGEKLGWAEREIEESYIVDLLGPGAFEGSASPPEARARKKPARRVEEKPFGVVHDVVKIFAGHPSGEEYKTGCGKYLSSLNHNVLTRKATRCRGCLEALEAERGEDN